MWPHEAMPSGVVVAQDVHMHEQEARASLDRALAHQECVKEAIQGISSEYHPYDLETGLSRSADALSSALGTHFSAIEEVASAANLSERCLKKIQKAKKLMTEMVATLVFFLRTIQAKVTALAVPPDIERAIYEALIPAIYLRLVAAKTTDVERRERLWQTAEDLLTSVRARHGPFTELEPEELEKIERVAEECAHVFQRSSSCVEGRNGQLALHHHSLHRLSARKLSALTAVHNFVVTRSDGTTAAERFFGAKPNDLFEYVLDTVELPGRPAQKRTQPKRQEYLLAGA
jgi:hypothetical protein